MSNMNHEIPVGKADVSREFSPKKAYSEYSNNSFMIFDIPPSNPIRGHVTRLFLECFHSQTQRGY
jgi:hypothetical protein